MTHRQLQPSMSALPTLRFDAAIIGLLVLLTAVPSLIHAGAFAYDPRDLFVDDKDPTIPGETFPSCVEVVAVWPEPYSLLKPSSMDSQYVTYEFQIKFSRPVFISRRDSTGGTHPNPHGNFMVFLSPSAYQYYGRYNPQHLGYWQSSRKMIIAKFTLRRGHLEAIARYFMCHGQLTLYLSNFIQSLKIG